MPHTNTVYENKYAASAERGGELSQPTAPRGDIVHIHEKVDPDPNSCGSMLSRDICPGHGVGATPRKK